MAERDTATGDLGLVQAFVNTLDIQPGTEELKDPNTLHDWLVAKALMEPSRPVAESDLKHARALREAMRSVIGANSGQRVYPVALATLNEAAIASRLRMRFGADGRARLEPEESGPVGAMRRVVASLYAAMQTDEWVLLKLCRSDTCRGEFFDGSKNHSSGVATTAACANG